MKKRIVSIVLAMTLLGAIAAPPAHAHRDRGTYLWVGVAVMAVVFIAVMVSVGVIGKGVQKIKGSSETEGTSRDVLAADVEDGWLRRLDAAAKSVDVNEEGFTTVRINW